MGSPSYTARRAALRHPEELARQNFLRFSPFGNNGIRLTNGKETVRLPTKGQLEADDFETIRALAVLGLGIALLPSFMCADEMKEQKLVRVLPQWRGDKVSLSLVYPAQKFVAAKVRAFIAVANEILNRK